MAKDRSIFENFGLTQQELNKLFVWQEDGHFPGWCTGIWKEGRWISRAWGGYARVVPSIHPMTWETIFDWASLTKPLWTAFLIVQEFAKVLDLPISVFGREFHECRVTLRNVLNHEAGFPDWEPLYLQTGSKWDRWDYLLNRLRTGSSSGTNGIYSCLDYQWLGLFLERKGSLLRDRLHEYHDGESCRTYPDFLPRIELRKDIAGVETFRAYEKRKSEERGFSTETYIYHQIFTWGQVHDLNAWTLGGVAGNAGLFGTPTALIHHIEKMVCTEPYYTQLTSAEFSGKTYHLGWHRGMPGLDGTEREWLYHSGFTGVCVAMRVFPLTVWFFFTNRIHPYVKQDTPIPTLRRELFRVMVLEKGL